MNFDYEITGSGVADSERTKSEYVTIGRAAKLLNVSIDTVRRLDNSGKLKSLRLDGKNRHFALADLEAYKQQQSLSTTEAANILGVSESTVRRLENQNLLVPERDENGRRQYAQSSLQAYLLLKAQPTETPEQLSALDRPTKQPEMPAAIHSEVLATPPLSGPPISPIIRLPGNLSQSAEIKLIEEKVEPEPEPKPVPTAVTESVTETPAVINGLRQRLVSKTGALQQSLRASVSSNTDNYLSSGSLLFFLLLIPLLYVATNAPNAQQLGIFDNTKASVGNIDFNHLDHTSTLSLPSTFFLQLPESGLTLDITNQSIQGTSKASKVVHLPITGDQIADGAIGSQQLSEGGIEWQDLSPNLQLLITTKSNKGPPVIISNYYTTNLSQTTVQSTTVEAGLGLNGTNNSNVLTLSLNQGASTQLVNNNLEVRLSAGVVTNTNSSGSGLESTASGLQLLGGCGSGQVLSWNGSAWLCSTTNTSNSNVAVQKGGSTITANATAVNFGANDFSVVNSGGGQATIGIDYANSGIARLNTNQAVTGNWSFADSGFTLTNAVDPSKQVRFNTNGLSSSMTRTLNVPDVSGILITTGNLNGITAVGTIGSGVWQGSTVGVQYGGTGASSFVNGGILYGNGVASLQATAAGTAGQLLIANSSGLPSFVSLNGDATLSPLGALTLAASGATAGNYGDGTHTPVLSVDNKGRITGVSNTLITGAAPVGSAGGDLTGNYPSPTIGKLQGNTLTISSLASGQILQYDGTAFVNQTLSGDITLSNSGVATIGAGKVSNADLANSSLNVNAGNGLSGGGNVALGSSMSLSVAYGASAGTAAEGNTAFTFNGSGNLTGSLSGTAGGGFTTTSLAVSNSPTFTTSVTTPQLNNAGDLSINATGAGHNLTLAAANSIILSGFNCTGFTNGGVLTTNSSGVVNCANNVGPAANTLTGTGTANRLALFNGANTLTNSVLAQSGSALRLDNGSDLSLLGGNLSVTGNLTASGTITLGGLAATGVLHTNALGVLSTSAVALGSDTSGSYVTNLGTLTGLTTTGNSGAGSTPALSVAYGNTAATAVQGNTTLVCPSGSGNLSGGGTTITLGSGGSCGNLTISNNPTFTGSLVAQGASVTVGVSSQQGSVILNDGNGANNKTATLQGVAALAQNTTYTLPDPGQATATICLDTGNCSAVGSASGDLTGNYPNPTIAKFQGTTVTLASVTSGQILQYNGSAFVNQSVSGDITINGSGVTALGSGKVSNTNLAAGTFANITGTGVLAAGSIASGFGTISTANNISTTSALQGGSLSIAGGAFTVNSSGALTAATGLTSSGTITLSGLSTSGVVHNSAAGVLSTSAVALGTDTSGSYVANLGTLTGLSSTGNSGAGSTPTLSVAYGSGANTAVQGNTTLTCPSGSGNLSGGGTSITLGTGGTCGGLTIVNNPSFSGLISGSSNTTGLAITGAPTNSATSSLAQFGNAIAGGNAVANGGTYLGLNIPAAGAGSAADYLNFQTNGVSKFKVDNAGAVTHAGGVTVQSGGITATGNSTITGTLGSLTGLTSSGSITFSGLSTAGVVHNSAAGVLSTSAIALGTDTSGSYVANLGTLTGLSTTGNSGAGSTPSLSVAYGSGANTAVQGNTTLTCASGSGNLSGGGTSITLGTGGTCGALSIVNNPSFSGLVTSSNNTTGLALTGTPAASATSSLIQAGSAIASGNAVANGGTYFGLNAPAAGAGSAADFLNFQLNGTSKLLVTNAGAITATGQLTAVGVNSGTGSIQGTGGLSVTGNSTITGILGSLTGLTSSGSVTFNGLSSAGVVHNSAAGLLSTSAVALGTDTSGAYVTNLGTLTGLSTTGNSGTGSTPTLSVAYGSGSNTAVQGNVSLTCASGSGNLSGGGGSITLGAGGSCGAITAINNPNFSTSVTSPLGVFTGANALTLGTTGTSSGAIVFKGSTAASGTIMLQGPANPSTNNYTLSIPNMTASDTVCLQTLANCGGGSIGGSGSTNYIARFSGTSALTTGLLYDSGTAVYVNNTSGGGLFNVGTSNQFQVSSTGAVTAVGLNAGTGSIQGTGGLSVTGNSTITGTLGSLTGLTSSGAITFSGLSTAGIVHNSAAGLLSTSAVALGTDTSGSYVANIGTLTGLSTTGNSGAGSTPTLSVAYGSGANTAVQGNVTLTCASGSGNLSGGGTSITLGTGGTCGAITTVNNPSFSGLITGSSNTTGLAVTGAPAASATSSLIQTGSAIAGGNTVANGGTYFGLNAPAAGAGSAADYLNFQLNGTSKLLVTNAGAVTAAGLLTSVGLNAGTGLIQGTGGLTITGTTTLSSLNSAGVVHTNASGVLSTSAVALGTDTSGNYVANLGALNGLSTTGNSGAGSTPTLSVAYGSGANTAVQGNTTLTCPSGTGNLSGGGTAITLGTGGTCGGLTIVNNPSFSGLISGSSNTTGLALTGTPAASATSSLTQFGSAIAGGNSAANGGTYIGLNAPAAGAGSAADFVNFQVNGVSALKIDNTGLINTTGGLAVSGTTVLTSGKALQNLTGLSVNSGGASISGNSTIAGTLGSLTGLNSSGSITFSGLSSTGIVHNSAAGLLSTSAVALGTDTSGSYVANLGTLTGLSTTGNSGAGSTPTLSVAYGSGASTAVQGNTTLTCPSGTGNLSGGGTSITLGTGGTCGGLTIVNNPSFSGLISGSSNTTGLALTGTPAASATSSLTQFGSAIAGGNSAANGGTYLGLNLPAAGAGSAADYLNFQTNGTSKYKVDNTGAATYASGLTIQSGGAAITGNTTITGTLGSLTGLTSSGAITFSGLSSAGIVHNSAAGLLSTGTVANSELTNSSLTVMAGTGLSGGGSVSLGGSSTGLSVNYGATSTSAVRGDTTLICASGSGNLSGGGNTITLGSGGTCSGLTEISNPSYSGLVSANAGLTVIGGTASINAGASTSNTTIGNTTGTFTLASSTLNISAGAFTGVTSLALSGAITGATSSNTINGLVISSGALSSITSLSLSGGISGGTTYSGSGNINTSGGGLQTNSSTRVDNTGNLTNIGNLTTTGASTFTATGSNGFTFTSGTNNSGTLRVQNSSGQNVLSVDTTGVTGNLVNNPSIESAISGNWAAHNTGATAAQTATQSLYGTNSLQIGSGSTTNGGAQQTLTSTLTASTQYNVNFYAKANALSATPPVIKAVYSVDGTTESVVCSNTLTLEYRSWQRYSCTFTTPASGILAANAIFIEATTTGQTFFVDAVMVQLSSAASNNYQEGKVSIQGTITGPVVIQNTSDTTNALLVNNKDGGQIFNIDTGDYNNLVDNPSFETNTTGWTAIGTAPSIARDTSQQKFGLASEKVVSGTAVNGGTRYAFSSALATGTYTISFSMLTTSVGHNFVQVGYNNGASDTFNTCSSATVSPAASATQTANVWVRYTCTAALTTPASILITSSAVSKTFFVDAVQVETGSTATAYGLGQISLGADIITPLHLKNQSDSTNALQIQNAAGSVLVDVDTSASTLTVSGTAATFASLTITNAHFKSTQSTSPTVAAPTNCGTSTAAVTANSTDTAGSFYIDVSNVTGATAACSTIVTVNKAYGAAPKSIILTPNNTLGGVVPATALIGVLNASSTTTFTVKLSAIPAVSRYGFSYMVIE